MPGASAPGQRLRCGEEEEKEGGEGRRRRRAGGGGRRRKKKKKKKKGRRRRRRKGEKEEEEEEEGQEEEEEEEGPGPAGPGHALIPCVGSQRLISSWLQVPPRCPERTPLLPSLRLFRTEREG